MNQGIVAAMEFLAEEFPAFSVTEARARAWEALLGHHPPERLMAAAAHAALTWRHGAPPMSVLAEYLDGRLVERRVPILDAWNGDTGGWRMVPMRVFPDGREIPARELPAPQPQLLLEGTTWTALQA